MTRTNTREKLIKAAHAAITQIRSDFETLKKQELENYMSQALDDLSDPLSGDWDALENHLATASRILTDALPG